MRPTSACAQPHQLTKPLSNSRSLTTELPEICGTLSRTSLSENISLPKAPAADASFSQSQKKEVGIILKRGKSFTLPI
jgi:hypothetical protein